MSKVIISRIKGQSEVVAEVKTWSDDKSIGVEMALDQYNDLLAAAIGNPALLLTMDQLKRKMTIASEEVVRLMKQETKKVV